MFDPRGIIGSGKQPVCLHLHLDRSQVVDYLGSISYRIPKEHFLLHPDGLFGLFYNLVVIFNCLFDGYIVPNISLLYAHMIFITITGVCF